MFDHQVKKNLAPITLGRNAMGRTMESVEGHGAAEEQDMTDLRGHIDETSRLCGSLTHMLQRDAQVGFRVQG